MNKYLKILIVGLVAIVPVSAALAAFSEKDWQFKRAITVPSSTGAGYVKVNLDKDVYAGSADLRDLRVISDSQEEIPYQLVEQQNTYNAQYYSSTILNNSVRGGRTIFIIDLGRSGTIHNRISITSSSRNYKKPVAVYAADSLLSHDDAGWRQLTQNQYIYNFNDSQLGFNAGSGEVAYPKSTSRYLRVVIGEGEGEIVSVSNARVYAYEVVAGDQDTLKVTAEISQNAEAQSTEVVIDLGAHGVPSHSIQLGSSDRNFNRRVVIQGSNDKTNWNLINQGYIFNVQTSLFTGSQMSLSYPEARTRYIRAIIFNEDNKPLNLNSSVTVKSTVRSVVFEADPSVPYSLYYGNSRASAPRYDLARLFQYIDTGRLAKASLEDVEVNSAYVAPPAPKLPFTEQFPYLLNILLVILVLIIGGFIVFYIRKMRV
jgi:hypothetical protein